MVLLLSWASKESNRFRSVTPSIPSVTTTIPIVSINEFRYHINLFNFMMLSFLIWLLTPTSLCLIFMVNYLQKNKEIKLQLHVMTNVHMFRCSSVEFTQGKFAQTNMLLVFQITNISKLVYKPSIKFLKNNSFYCSCEKKLLKHTCILFFHLDAEQEFENKICLCISHMEWQQWLIKLDRFSHGSMPEPALYLHWSSQAATVEQRIPAAGGWWCLPLG